MKSFTAMAVALAAVATLILPGMAAAHGPGDYANPVVPAQDVGGSQAPEAPSAARAAAGPVRKALCGQNDRPEPGLQGQTPLVDMLLGRSQDPYFCGVRVVEHTDIWNRGANFQLARSQRCAYVSTVKTFFLADNEDPVTWASPRIVETSP